MESDLQAVACDIGSIGMKRILNGAAMPAMRVDPADFQKLDLRCHALLSDVPLHDVWAIPLPDGGPGRTIDDFRALLLGGRWPGAERRGSSVVCAAVVPWPRVPMG